MKTILITGASGGFGEAIAKTMAKYPYNLILTGRNAEKLSQVCNVIKDTATGEVLPLLFDIQDYEACQKSIASIPTHVADVDILINNAGLAVELNALHQGAIEDWERMINTNVKGLLYVTRLIAPNMVRKKSGHIVNIGSTSSYEVYGGGNVYCATKHAVLALTRAMRTDFLPYGIKVTQVSPGAAETNFSVVRFHGDKAKADKVYEGFDPLEAQDVASVVEFVLTRPPHVCINEITLSSTAQFNGVVIRE